MGKTILFQAVAVVMAVSFTLAPAAEYVLAASGSLKALPPLPMLKSAAKQQGKKIK